MTELAIIGKLRTVLEATIQSECQVVYFLIELRKLMDLKQDGRDLGALRFACDWVAHPFMDRKPAQRILRLFDRYQAMMEALKVGEFNGHLPDLNGLQEILGLARLKAELHSYLELHHLNPRLTTDDQQWGDFLVHYTRTIEDCPLTCEDNEGLNLEFVEKVVVKVMDVHPIEAGAPYRLMIRWTWVCKTTDVEQNIVRYY